jgi:hypothetical protein
VLKSFWFVWEPCPWADSGIWWLVSPRHAAFAAGRGEHVRLSSESELQAEGYEVERAVQNAEVAA